MDLSHPSDIYVQFIKKTMQKNIPFLAHWELTYRCNLNCFQCYCPKEDKDQLDYAQIKMTLEDLSRRGCLFLVFSGGEIFMREDFFKIAFYAKRLHFALRLLTNGTLIDEEALDKLKQLCPLSVEISLYGATADCHDAITRSPGSFEKSINVLRRLKEIGLHTAVKSLMMKDNIKELGALRRLAIDLGAEFVCDLTVVAKDKLPDEVLKHRLDESYLREVFQTSWQYKDKLMEVADDENFMCSAGLNNIMISAYGEVYPCIAIKRSLGNLRHHPLDEILASEVLRQIKTIRFADLWFCRTCKINVYCRRCPGLALQEDKDLLGPSTPDCRLARIREEIATAKVK